MHLRTSRLLLREFSLEDVPAVLDYQRDARYLRFAPWHDRTEAEVRAFVQRFLDWQQAEPRSKYQLAIVLSSTGELIGNVGLRLASADARIAELGYELAPGHWGFGYATESARALLAYGFDTFHLHRVHSHCIAENSGSSRVLERLGMKLEGKLRQHQFLKERWWDVLLYGILASEWQAQSHSS